MPIELVIELSIAHRTAPAWSLHVPQAGSKACTTRGRPGATTGPRCDLAKATIEIATARLGSACYACCRWTHAATLLSSKHHAVVHVLSASLRNGQQQLPGYHSRTLFRYATRAGVKPMPAHCGLQNHVPMQQRVAGHRCWQWRSPARRGRRRRSRYPAQSAAIRTSSLRMRRSHTACISRAAQQCSQRHTGAASSSTSTAKVARARWSSALWRGSRRTQQRAA